MPRKLFRSVWFNLLLIPFRICSQLLRRLAFAGLALTAAPLFAADVTSTWGAATSGVWNVNGNWLDVPALGGFPNNGNGGVATYDAVISAAGPAYTVTLNTNVTVEDLTLSSANATINHTAGTFTATGAIEVLAGAYQLSGGTISNTVINVTGGNFLFTSSGGFLSNGALLNGDLNLAVTSANVRLQSGASFTGVANLSGVSSLLAIEDTQTLTGKTINLDGSGARVSIEATNTLTLGAGTLVRGRGNVRAAVSVGGTSTLLNAGTIRADLAGQTLTISPNSFTNQAGGVLEATNGSVLSVPNGYTQTGGATRAFGTATINSSTIQLVGGSLEGTGAINATVNSTGIIDFDAGGRIVGTLNATGGVWNGLGSVTGLTTVSGGTFTVGSGGHLRANGGLNVTGTGMIAAADETGTITANVNYLSSSNSTFGGVLAGADRTLILNNPAATLTLAGTNTYTGATTVTAGTLRAGAESVPGVSGAFGRNSAVTMANSASAGLDLAGFDTQIGSLSGGGASGGNVTLGAATLTFGGNDTSPAVYGGTISGTGAITKNGLGTQTLTRAQTYMGRTTASGGTLRLDFAALATPTDLLNNTSALTLGGGTLSLLGKSGGGVVTAQTLGDVTLSANTFSTIALDPNNSGAGGTTLTLGNAWTRAPGSTLLIDMSSASTGARSVRTTAAMTGSGAAGPNGIFGYALVKDSGGTGFAKQDGSFNFIRNTTAGTVLTTSNSVAGTTGTDFTTVSTDPGYSGVGGTLTLANVAHAASTLSIDTTGGGTLNLGGAAGVFALTNNALLVQGAGNYTIQNGALGASGSEVIVHQIGSGLLTISSPVSGGAGSLTKDGSGTLTLTGLQDYATLTTGGGITNLQVSLGTGSSTINANARTNLTTSQTLAALNIGDGGVVTLSTVLPAAPADGFDEGSIFADHHDAAAGLLTGAPVGAVPEPGSASLLVLGALALLGRRRRGGSIRAAQS